MRRLRLLAMTCALSAAALGAPAPADARELLSTTVRAAEAVDRICHARSQRGVRGVDRVTLAVPQASYVRARLTGGRGDWDLAVFDRRTGRVVAASAYRGSREVASGFAFAGERLVVRACRREGASRKATVKVTAVPVPTGAGKVSLARVDVPDRFRMAELQRLGLDLTEEANDQSVEVVLHGPADEAKLRLHKFPYTILVGDLVAQDRRHRATDRAYARSVATSGLPSGRTGYRLLADYSADMKRLVDDNPGLVRWVELPYRTFENRPVQAIEIASDVDRQDDGRPVFLQMGVHHAREWPSGEHAMEWAVELVNGVKSGDPRAARLVRDLRTIVVPIVNPDGFNISRTAGEVLNRGSNGGRNSTSFPYEYQRKNCRLLTDQDTGTCLQPGTGGIQAGVDPNRNYGGFWGGGGTSTDVTTQTYLGKAPFSEPETRNVKHLLETRHVTALITNHTYSNLVLRPPGIKSHGVTPDEPFYAALGGAMAAENGYKNDYSYGLYDTTGTTEDFSYWHTGGFGYTFEIGPTNFHPPFAETVAEWEGTTTAADRDKNGDGQGDDGRGNREAYYLISEAAADAGRHSIVTGNAPPGATLRLTKSFEVLQSADRDGDLLPDMTPHSVETEMTVPASGRYEWRVNPSTRPAAMRDVSRPAVGTQPSPPLTFSGLVGTDAAPCANYNTTDEKCWNDHPFTVPAEPGRDNGKARIRLEWPTPGSDWDMKVFRDTDGNGSSRGEPSTALVGSSGNGPSNWEQSVVKEPDLVAGEKYVVRVINWAAAEPYTGTITWLMPDPYVPARTEAWTLTCERNGEVLQRKSVVVARGARQRVDLGRCNKGGRN